MIQSNKSVLSSMLTIISFGLFMKNQKATFKFPQFILILLDNICTHLLTMFVDIKYLFLIPIPFCETTSLLIAMFVCIWGCFNVIWTFK